MLTELCAITRNYFLDDSSPFESIHSGKYTISGSSIWPLDFLSEGQYFRIVGSRMNDGVYKYPASGLIDETFSGAIWAMNVPPAFVKLAEEIKAYRENASANPSVYVSESFGGYSYTKATGKNGAPLSWQTIFAERINPYRRIRVL